MEAARKLFVSKNYNDVTMAEIAGEAEVTKGALYHHFDSKETLYLAMMHEYLEEVGGLLRTAAEHDGTSRQRLHRFTITFLQLPEQKRDLMKLVRRDINVLKDPERDQLIRAYQKALPETAQSIIREGIEDGEIAEGDARLLSWEHVAMVEVVLGAYAKQVLKSTEAMTDYVVDLFFDGCATPVSRSQ
jgi:AcrR family transcriptional regulator